MNSYEFTIILRNSALEALNEKFRGILQKHNVEITSEEEWGNRRLAYEIDGETEGHYIFMNLNAQPDTIQKIINEFRLNSDILRYMFVRMKKKTAV